MKRCPVCHRFYPDPTIYFCLDDGSALTGPPGGTSVRETSPPPRASDAPTEALPSRESPGFQTPTLPVMPAPAPQFVRRSPAPQPSPDKRKILLWVVAGVLMLGVGIVSAYLLVGARSDESRADVRVNANNSNTTSNTSSAKTPVASTPTATATPTATPYPSATPTPTPTPNTASARSEVMAVMNSWAESLRRQDLNANLRLYADRLDAFYQMGSASKGQVRSNRQSIFAKYYSSTDVQLSNISIDIDPYGTKATVSYDNAYNWRGGSKYLTGKSHNQMVLSKVGSQWLITSESHLQTYYENSSN